MDDTNEQRPRLGEMLVSRGAVGRLDVHAAMRQQGLGDARRLGEILVARGAIAPDVLADALQELGVEVDLPEISPVAREVRDIADALEARAGGDPGLALLVERLRRVQAALTNTD